MRPFRGLRGQTLLQLAAAMAIVAVAITLAIPAYRGNRLKAYLAEVRQIAGAWKKEVLSYHVRTGSWQGATDASAGWTFPPARWWTFLQTAYGPPGYPAEAWFRANLRPGLASFDYLPPELRNLPDYVLVLPTDGRAPLECGRALARSCGSRQVGNPGDGSSNNPPSPPLNLRVLATSYTWIAVAWDDSQNEDRYVVRWWTPGNEQNPFSSPNLAANTTSYRIENLSPNTTYEIRVSAYNQYGGADSNTVSAATLPIPEATLLTKAASGFTLTTRIFRVLQDGSVQDVCTVDPPGESGTLPAVLDRNRIATSTSPHVLYTITAPSCSTDTYDEVDHYGIAYVFNPGSDWVGVSQYFPLSGFRSVGRFRRSNPSATFQGELAPLSSSPVFAIAVAPDGTVTYYYHEDRTLRTTPSHQHVATLPESIYSVAYHHSTGRLAWIGNSNRLFVGTLQGPWTQIPGPPEGTPRSVAWSGDGQLLWVVTWGPSRLWLLEPDGTTVYSWSTPDSEPVLVYADLSW